MGLEEGVGGASILCFELRDYAGSEGIDMNNIFA